MEITCLIWVANHQWSDGYKISKLIFCADSDYGVVVPGHFAEWQKFFIISKFKMVMTQSFAPLAILTGLYVVSLSPPRQMLG
jgi:hypothetical protein